MDNNNEIAANHKDSLGSAISTISHPFDNFTAKIECVTLKFHLSDYPLPDKIAAWKVYFKAYYEKIELYNYYGLTIIEPF